MDTGWRKRLSCGVVILNDQAELLLCHVTGQAHWDLPKGGLNDGETPLQAALRETREETGLLLDPEALLDLGQMPYRSRKDLHLFATRLPRLDTNALWCESAFSDLISGQRRPEMDAFGWFAFDAVNGRCTRRMAAVLQQRLSLHGLLAQLQDSGLQSPYVGSTQPAPPAPAIGRALGPTLALH
jgi:8-oxo-dGTP pyrophosphatase MutT (NUDIX family)